MKRQSNRFGLFNLPRTTRVSRRRRLFAESLEDRCLLAALDLTPVDAAVSEENGTRTVNVLAGTTLKVSARALSAERPIEGFSLDFSASNSQLILSNFENNGFPASVDPDLDSQANDFFVAYDAFGELPINTARSLGTFDVIVPQTPGNYVLSITGSETGQGITQLTDVNDQPLDISAFGDLTLGVRSIENASVVSIAESQRVPEDAETASVEVTLSQASDIDLVVPYTLTGTAIDGEDYSIEASPLAIPRGSQSASISIAITDDELAELDETIIISLGEVAGAELGEMRVNTTTISDNDSPLPTVQLTTIEQSVAEDSGRVNIVAAVSIPATTDIEIPFTIGGTAELDSDYQTNDSTIIIRAGETTGAAAFDIIDDETRETDETIILTISETEAFLLGETISQTVTIIDNDQPPPPTIFLRSPVSAANEGGGNVVLTAFLSEAFEEDISISFTVSGTATQEVDYVITDSPIVIPAGETSTDITIRLNDDTEVEPTETILVELIEPDNGVLDATASRTVTIFDNDQVPLPTIELQATETVVSEASELLIVTAKLSELQDQSVVVPFSIRGTATRDVDYAVFTRQITFAPGTRVPDNPNDPTRDNEYLASIQDKSVNRVIEDDQIQVVIHLFDDAEIEGDETIEFVLGVPEGAALSDNGRMTFTITSDDGAPVPTADLQLGTQVTSEGDQEVIATVVLSEATEQDLSIPYTLSGTSTNGVDFAVTESRFLVPAGQDSASIFINLNDDVNVETTESVTVRLGESTAFSPGESIEQTVQIQDNESEAGQNVSGDNGNNDQNGGDTIGDDGVVDNNQDVDSGNGIASGQILQNELPVSTIVVPASSRPSAVLFSARQDTTLFVGKVGVASNMATITLMDPDLNVIATEVNRSLSAPLSAGQSYALLFGPSSQTSQFTIRSSEGFDALGSSSLTNFIQPTDVSGEGETTALDALMVVNVLDRLGASDIRLGEAESSIAVGGFYDVNADGRITALDALQIVNHLSREPIHTIPAGESITRNEVDNFIQLAEATALDVIIGQKQAKLASFGNNNSIQLPNVEIEIEESSTNASVVDRALADLKDSFI